MFVLTPSHHSARSLNRAVDRLFNESLGRVFGGDASDAEVRTPAMDVTESDTAYTVVLDVPGATKEQLQVSVQGRRISVETAARTTTPGAEPATVEKQVNAETKGSRVLYRERSLPRYARTISLPTEVDQSASQAKFEHGVLTLTLTKRVPTGATTLAIQ